jgi:serine/threonine protein kinase
MHRQKPALPNFLTVSHVETLMKLWRYGRPIENLGQRYRLEGILGSGGMADVCLAWDDREQREVAVKILKSDDLGQDTLNRFVKEAGQIAGWQHPHILHVYDHMQIELIDPTQGSVLFYIVMEYARGGDLQKRLAPGKPFPFSTAFLLFQQLCGAVNYAHNQGVIHRDLKPLNILFRRPEIGPEEVVLSDFGLAVQVDASHHTFARGGTLAYMAPEQFQGHAQPASDIFSLGVILYQLCTGRMPYRRAIQDLLHVGNEPVPIRPSMLNTDLPAVLDEPILHALRELPTERYRSAQEFWDTIASALTSVAQTYPAPPEYGSAVGETWPNDGSKRTSLDKQASRLDPSTPIGLVPAQLATPTEEEAVSTPGPVREKQKAFPNAVRRLSLPTYSIPRQPNLLASHLPEAGALRQDVSDIEAEEQYTGLPEVGTSFRSTLGPPTTRQDLDWPAQSGYSWPEPSIIALPPVETQKNAGNLARSFLAASSRATRTLLTGKQMTTPTPDVEQADVTTNPPHRQPALPLLQVRKKKRTPRRSRFAPVPVIAAVVLLALLIAIFAAAGAQGTLLRLFDAPTLKVTLTPRSQPEQGSFQLIAVTGTPDAARQQVQARLLQANSPTGSATANATGSIPAKRASGQLTFINNTAKTITIDSGTITGNSGVQIAFNGPITVLANPPTIIVTGLAANTGAAGNIPTLDIDKSCCAPDNEIFVKNTAFTGGEDAIPNSIITQNDINGAAKPLTTTLTQNAQKKLGQQVKKNERLINSSVQCQPDITANQQAGDEAQRVSVQVAVTCSEEVYDYQAASQLASNLLAQQVRNNSAQGTQDTLNGSITLTLLNTSTPDRSNNITLNIEAQGIWNYHFSATRLSSLAALIAGKNEQDARTLLLRQTGIADVQFSQTGNVPGTTAEIQFLVK